MRVIVTINPKPVIKVPYDILVILGDGKISYKEEPKKEEPKKEEPKKADSVTPIMMPDLEWYKKAFQCAEDAHAFHPPQVVHVMQSESVKIDEMEDWCEQFRLDYPCMVRALLPGDDS